jgi:transcriptional regulator with XRE-family HTH domain
MKQTFGELIESVRTERGLSAYGLGQRAGISDQAIRNLELTGQSPSLDTARRLAKALAVTLDWVDSQLPPIELPEPQSGRPRGRPPKAKEEPELAPKRRRGRPRKSG